MKNVRVILKFKSSQDNKGYIRISSRVGNKTVLKSINLPPIDKKHFNPKTQRIRVSHPEHEQYNEKIESILEKIKKRGNSNIHINDESISFILFIDKIINETNNYGTKSKYLSVKNSLIYFSKEKYDDIDIKFSDINHDFLVNFKNWLKNKNMKNNTIFYFFKTLKSLVNKGIKHRYYSYEFNPFGLIENKLEENSVVYLNIEEIRKIINTDVKEVYRGGENNGKIITDEKVLNDIRYRRGNSLKDIKNFFLFQIFSGLRVSDVMSLRWNDFYIDNDEIRVQKRMIKTKKNVDFLVNYNCVNILKNYIPTSLLTDEITEKVLNLNKFKRVKKQNYNEFTKVKIQLNSEEISQIDFDFHDGYYWISLNEIQTKRLERETELLRQYNLSSDDKILLKYSKSKDLFKNKDDEFKSINKISNPVDFLKISESVKTDKILLYLNKLDNFIKTYVELSNTEIKNQSEKSELDKYNTFLQIIDYLSSNEHTRNLFCFSLIKNSDFESIDDSNDFGRMNEIQYSKFISGRTYYNILLKYVVKQCGINKKVSTHTSRHSYTSLMVQQGDNLNLYDVMTSLGHTSLSTTEKYIQKFKNSRVDNINKKISDLLNKTNS
jgi:integrase